MFGVSVIAFVITVGILIFVHELGHFIVAKVFGVGIHTFSLGFGPSLLKRNIGETTYKICLIPLGGYVKMVGESPEELAEDKQKSFSHKPLSDRVAIVGAGPLSNLIFATMVFSLIFLFWGIPQLTTDIGGVKEGSPADRAGMLENDRIVAINHQKVTKWTEMSETVRGSRGEELLIHVDRSGEIITFKVRPEISTVTNMFGETLEVPLIGIADSGKFILERVGPFVAVYRGVEHTLAITKIFALVLVKLIQGAVSIKDSLGGPLLIAQMAGQQAKQGVVPLISFAGSLSVSLGLINLLPIPILDGGHLLFFLIEVVLGRPVSIKKKEVAQQIGLVVLILLMVFVFYNDFSRIFLNQ